MKIEEIDKNFDIFCKFGFTGNRVHRCNVNWIALSFLRSFIGGNTVELIFP